MTSARRLAGLILPLAVLAVTSPASAATVTVTGDGGAPVGLPTTIRNMDPQVQFAFAPDEKQYEAIVLGPAGSLASTSASCLDTAPPNSPKYVDYQGNGTYTVVLKVSKNERYTCEDAVEERHTFTINAFTSIVPPASQPLLMRQPGSFTSIPFEVPLDLNPGASTHELLYAAGAVLGPDGGISGPTQQGFVNSSTGRASITFSKPGRYTFVARAKRLSQVTAWSAPVHVTVVAPFDLLTTSFPDSRGPSYKLAGQLREPSATGKVTISIGKGKKAKRFKKLGTAKIRSGGKFALKFRLRKPGSYTLRYSYRGGPTVARGTAKEIIKISRRIF